MTSYRLLTAEEIPSAVQLWVEVFAVEAEFFNSLLRGGDADDFSVGAFEDGRIVSSVHVFMRWFRDREGRPQKVGGIGSVSTLSDHRAKGHSSKLLALAVEGMAARGCVWSYLGTGVNPHYARAGWRTVSTPFFTGQPKPATEAVDLQKQTVTDSFLDQMAMVHSAYSRSRPMANDRSPAIWAHAVRYRVTRPEDEVFARFSGENLVAYLVCNRSQQDVEFVEAACLPGGEGELQSLIRRRIASASGQVTSSIEENGPAHPAFVEACSRVTRREDLAWMVRPIAEGVGFPELMAIQGDPRGRRSGLDNF